MRNWAFLFGGFTIAVGILDAQHDLLLDSTKTFKEFEVVDTRLQWRDVEQNLIRFHDNLLRPLGLEAMDFGDRFSLEMPVFIRNYGPGSLSTASVRGFSAQHTGFVWNGFNIQNPMNATPDMSLFPTWLMENVSFRQGPSTDVWGNGTIGGAVVSQTTYQDEPILLSLHQSIGSFGQFNTGLKAQFNHKRLRVKLGGMRRIAENDFPFIDHSHPEKPIRTQENAQFEANDLMASALYQFNQKHSISYDLWVMQANRNIPGIISVINNTAFQNDQSIRNNLAYYFTHKQSKFTFRTAYFKDRLHFIDSLMLIDSQNQSNSFLSDLLYEVDLPHNWRISANLFYGYYQAEATGYQSFVPQQQRKVAMLAAEKTLMNKRLHTTFRLRRELLDSRALPFTPAFHSGYQLPKAWTINISGALSYRVPTFNDLFWQPGGNPNLHPEEGNHIQANIHKKARIHSTQIELKTMAYHSTVANWIQWQPISVAIWTPNNIQTVVNQGVELYLKMNGNIQQWQWYFQANAAFVKASGKQSGGVQQNQLIYVPRHQANVQAGFSQRSFRFMVYHQFTGLRYTTTDNSHFLPAFQLTGIQISQELKWKQNEFQLFATCNNLFNKDYQVLMMRAMPGRNFQTGLNYKITKQKIKQIQT